MLKWLRGKLPPLNPVAPAPAPEPAAPEIDADALAELAQAAAIEDPDELMRQAFPLHEGGDLEGAALIYRRILEIDPDYADAHYLLGRLELDAGRLDDALPHLRRALRANNKEPAFHRSVGELFFAQGHWNEAIAYFQNAADLTPDDPQVWTNLGLACQRLGQLAEASEHFAKALKASQTSPQAINNVAMSLKDRGRIDEALAHFEQGLAIAPDNRDLLDNYLYTLNFSTRHSAADIFRAHAVYDRHFGSEHWTPAAVALRDADPARRLRVAYFSPDLRSHPVAIFLEPALRHHDPAAVESFCYHLHPWGDGVTQRLKDLAHRWVDCRGMDDDAIAERLQQDGIDILVDLAGHTGNNRLPVLGRKPVPVTATWLGYPGTTGLRTVDWKITDAVSDPPGSEPFHTEQLMRLPARQWCYTRPDVAPDLVADIGALPALASGRIRFGSFNHASKINDETLEMWAVLMRRLQHSCLLVWGVAEEQAAEIRKLMGEEGIERERLELVDRSSFPAQLALYRKVDVALDTFPYSGVTTTFNALWMGVPVLTRSGETPASRSSEAILGAIGLDDWCVRSAQEFIEAGARLCGDVNALATLRAGLRQRLESSPLMDGAGFTRGLEAAYREMWRARLGQAP